MIRLLCLFAFVTSAYKIASKVEKLKFNLEVLQGSCSSATTLQFTTSSFTVTRPVPVGTSSTFLCSATRTNNPVQVFYKYSLPTGTTAQTLAINTFGSSYDTMLAAWSCTTCGATPLTCIDDSSGTRQSAITVNVNDCIYIGVAGYNKAIGNLNLTVKATATTPPPNTNVIKSTTAAPTTCPADYHTIQPGSPCAVTTRCDYEPVCCCPNAPNPADRQCSPSMMFTCSNGVWDPAMAALVNCAGAQCPAVPCPDEAPSGTCNSGQSCKYEGVACCPDHDFIQYKKTAECNGGMQWNVTAANIACPPCPLVAEGGCPESRPNNGEPCNRDPTPCNYFLECCCGTCFFSSHAVCNSDTKEWGINEAWPGCPCRTATATPPTAEPPTAEPPTAIPPTAIPPE